MTPNRSASGVKYAEIHSIAPFIVWIHAVILEELMVTVPTTPGDLS